MTTFQAYRIEGDAGASKGRLVEMTLDALDPGDVTVRTLASGVNFKDALAGHNAGRVVERFPCNGGIEAVGHVARSRSAVYREGDPVILHGRGLGVRHDGGFAAYVRAPADWITPLPAGLSPREAAIVGVAGHTAAIAIDLMELNGLIPGAGPVAVTGASGGVGSLALAMLAARGYEAIAVTRRTDQAGYLTGLGAAGVRAAPIATGKARALEEPTWAGAVDAAGGAILEWLIRTARPGALIACFGNTAGAALNTTVFPFILRGVRLIGVNANTETGYRRRIWERTATDLRPRDPEAIAETIEPAALHDAMAIMLRGEGRGRKVVSF